jgi:hypothetical protein
MKLKRALLCAAILSAACGNSNQQLGSGQFVAPTGLGISSARDRDVVFVAGTGRDGLRALQICYTDPTTGQVAPSCASSDLQFLPGPIRVFPANIETDDRPLRLAGARLTSTVPSDGGVGVTSNAGIVLVVGADKSVKVVDVQNIVNAPDTGTANPALSLPLDGVGVDIVADNVINSASDLPSNPPAGVAVPAFVVTAANETAPAELIELSVSLDANNAAQLPTIKGKCTLGTVVPTRVAIAQQEAPAQISPCPADGGLCTPGAPTSDVFVADGAGDGVVRVPRASIEAGGVCTVTRISAGGRSVNSIALSPQWYEGTISILQPDGGVQQQPLVPHPAGEYLMMVTKPDPVPTPGLPLDPGGALFANLCNYQPGHDDPTNFSYNVCTDQTAPGKIVPIPPFPADGTAFVLSDGGVFTMPDGGAPPPMEPINPSGIASEAGWAAVPRPGPANFCAAAPCVGVFTGAPSNEPVQFFPLVALMSSSDGATYFIDTLNRRFVDSNFFNLPANFLAQIPTFGIQPTVVPATDVPIAPTLVGLDPDQGSSPLGTSPELGHANRFWVAPGLTHTATWRVVWHATIPGLGRRGGTLTKTDHGTYFFEGPGDFAVAQADPVLKFAAGDFVSFAGYSLNASSNSSACQILVNGESSEPLRFELQVLAINPDGAHPGRLELADNPAASFNPGGACPAVDVLAEMHIGGSTPWLVFQNFDALARIGQNQAYAANERRFDYSSDYSPESKLLQPTPAPLPLPLPELDQGLAFQIIGDQPDVPNTEITFTIISQLAPVSYRDPLVNLGYATSIATYSSARFPGLLFTAVTGSDSVVAAVPSVLQSQVNGIEIYR